MLATLFSVSCETTKKAVVSNPDPAPQSQATAARPFSTEPIPREWPGLHNVVAFHESLISGSAPESDAAFDSLSALGVKTIISVDGALPEVAKAQAHGLRYIHLPIGYNGIDDARKRQLARATRDAIKNGPAYIHCHHGKHRGPTAAAVIAVGLGWMTPAQGVERMRASGTAANYQGLYDCAARATRLASSEIDDTSGDFAPVWTPSSFVKGMLDIDAALDNLKTIERAGWQTPRDHADLVPAAEAERLADLFRVLTESAYAKDRDAAFSELLESSRRSAGLLEVQLLADAADQASLSARFRELADGCKDCHARYRD